MKESVGSITRSDHNTRNGEKNTSAATSSSYPIVADSGVRGPTVCSYYLSDGEERSFRMVRALSCASISPDLFRRRFCFSFAGPACLQLLLLLLHPLFSRLSLSLHFFSSFSSFIFFVYLLPRGLRRSRETVAALVAQVCSYPLCGANASFLGCSGM